MNYSGVLRYGMRERKNENVIMPQAWLCSQVHMGGGGMVESDHYWMGEREKMGAPF